ncbi:hypothetical protein QNA08_09560 [Chelatococcus sp. SYSU_G07232]|uniref:DUF2502 domain-containing protein n=1 Tax=Chelatococcus albus TaxID=3047466 RepID=A0ABT7AGI5_9HYPH|nr:hypothetical protein [Chelatococcus sp. SYSU_G07232]MDJ1158480.1 hypothetical protein [Chelatococcus sp. SYSU_G07232]
MAIRGTVVMLAVGLTAGLVGTAAADSWKDESGKGHWRGGYERDDDGWSAGGYRRYRKHHAYKEKYRRGGCEIERKWDGDEYKEKIKCKRGWGAPAYGHYRD